MYPKYDTSATLGPCGPAVDFSQQVTRISRSHTPGLRTAGGCLLRDMLQCHQCHPGHHFHNPHHQTSSLLLLLLIIIIIMMMITIIVIIIIMKIIIFMMTVIITVIVVFGTKAFFVDVWAAPLRLTLMRTCSDFRLLELTVSSKSHHVTSMRV